MSAKKAAYRTFSNESDEATNGQDRKLQKKRNGDAVEVIAYIADPTAAKRTLG